VQKVAEEHWSATRIGSRTGSTHRRRHCAREHARIRSNDSFAVSHCTVRRLQNDIDKPLAESCIAWAYPPGSTVKRCMRWRTGLWIISRSRRNIVPAFSPASSSNKYRDDKKTLFEHAPSHRGSCDVYFYRSPSEWASSHGRFHEDLGYGALTGIDIPGKSRALRVAGMETAQLPAAGRQVWFPARHQHGIGQGPITSPLCNRRTSRGNCRKRTNDSDARLVTLAVLGARTRSRLESDVYETIVSPTRINGVSFMTECWEPPLRGTAYVPVSEPSIKLRQDGTAQVFTIKQTENTRAKIVDERRLITHGLSRMRPPMTPR